MQVGKLEKSVVIVGIRGYSGLELARLILDRPDLRLAAGFVTETGSAWNLGQAIAAPSAQSVPILPMSALDSFLKETPEASTFFLATPAEASLELVPKLLTAGKSVIDLSGAFRLEPSEFAAWYVHAHSAPALCATATYGLVPWAAPVSTQGPALIANPGCYATAVLMALIPLLKSGAIRPDTLVIDAKSGTTGAGRKASEHLLFSEVDGECLPYRIGKHQHLPEIVRYAQRYALANGPTSSDGAIDSLDPIFATHLLPIRRGIIAGLYARLSPELAKLAPADQAAKLQAIFTEAYAAYPLVQHGPAEKPGLLSLKRVAGTAFTQIGYSAKGDQLQVFSLIDNLLKGAASQALENFNRLNDLPAQTGLLTA